MITLHSTEANDVTVLSNVFIDRFMPRAGGEFVKVYIYLLRMLGSRKRRKSYLWILTRMK